MGTIIDKAVSWALSVAKDNKHGYDQSSRWGPNYDCSAFVISAYEYAGVKVKAAGATYTGNMKAAFIKCGFQDVTKSVNLNTGKGLKKGDVLLIPGSHAVIVASDDGATIVNCAINENGKTTGGKSGDQTGKEIYVRGYYKHSSGEWAYVLRYPDKSTSTSKKSSAGTADETTTKESKEITYIQTITNYSGSIQARPNIFDGLNNTHKNDIELFIINHSGNIVCPIIDGTVELQSEISGSPAELTFTVIKDGDIVFHEGSQVVFKYKSKPVFYGFVFEKQRSSEQHIKIIAYDQLRYFKNKTSMVYNGVTADKVLKDIIRNVGVVGGNIANTGVRLPATLCDNKTYYDIVYEALTYTTEQGGGTYCLYDDFGKITLAPTNSMITNLVINEDTAEDFEYTSSINSDSYSRIELYRDNSETGVRTVHVYNNLKKIKEWGVLTYSEQLEENEDGRIKAITLGQTLGKKTRNLKVKNAFGDVIIRGGSQVFVDLDIGDITVKRYLTCRNVKHKFDSDSHFMDIELIGGVFDA